ncbi:MAG: hypothetical protein HY699_16155 [Deltaproteobacteria bacterium]|nr:hypothetical protein [Deltaproteobacteria bacterium]
MQTKKKPGSYSHPDKLVGSENAAEALNDTSKGLDDTDGYPLLESDTATRSRCAYSTHCGVSGDKVYWPAAGISWSERTTLVLALCLDTGLYDLERRNLYGIRHGLETVETYFRQTRAVRPIKERLRDRARLVQAVEATLGPLAGPRHGARE